MGVRTLDATKKLLESNSTDRVPDPRTPLESDSGGLQPPEKLSPVQKDMDGNILPRPACNSFLIKAQLSARKNWGRLPNPS